MEFFMEITVREEYDVSESWKAFFPDILNYKA